MHPAHMRVCCCGRYEAVVFLFVVHPFDVGDTIILASGDMVKVR